MNEDRSSVRTGARAMVALRNRVLSLLRNCGASVPAAREAFAVDAPAAIKAVTARIL